VWLELDDVELCVHVWWPDHSRLSVVHFVREENTVLSQLSRYTRVMSPELLGCETLIVWWKFLVTRVPPHMVIVYKSRYEKIKCSFN
jgi:hypothetical protein